MRVALAQLNPLIGDIDGAMRQVTDAAGKAKAQGADLLVFPEMFAIGGYPPRDLIARRYLVQRQWTSLQETARSLPIPALVGCIEPLEPGTGPQVANCLAVIDQGKIVHCYRKRLLPTYDVFDEQRYFRPGDSSAVVTIAGKRVGLTVCEDIWSEDFSGVRYHQDPLGELAGKCDLVVNISASPYSVDKPHLRRRLVQSLVKRLKVPVCYCNQVGGQDELLFDGDSCIVGAKGEFFASAPRWSESITIGDIGKAIATPTDPEPIADLYQALVVGIRDYCAKTKQKKVVLGLSGGIDSALVATLAVDALGAANVIGILMPGPFSSQGSIDDSLALAKNLGIAHHTVPITGVYQSSLAELAVPFAGKPHDIAEENLQSRLRGVMVMAMANKHGAMALTTGNKSEIATGYCTIYGDMNGGLAPIGDVYKTQVWQLSRHANRSGARIPEASISKLPSAELRANQLDSDSLPPYEILDRILKRYLEDDWSVEQIIETGEDAATVKRIARLVEVSEFKRRQSAPVLRVTRKAFGVGRRMPIARYF